MKTEMSGHVQPRINRYELVTIQDLQQFKAELQEDFKVLLKSNGGQVTKNG